MIEFEFDEKSLRAMRRLASDSRHALCQALNDIAFKVMHAERAEMARVFDRPTPWVIRGVQVAKAKPDGYFDSRTGQSVPGLTAIIGGSDYSAGKSGEGSFWDRVISPHVEGGRRLRKATERRLSGAGLLPSGWYVVPGAGARLDKYGNMSGGQITQVLSWIGAMNQYSGDNLNKSDRQTKRKSSFERSGKAYFVARVGNRNRLAPGVYLRDRGGRAVPILMFVRSATYRRRLDWYGVGVDVVRTSAPQAIAAAYGRLWR